MQNCLFRVRVTGESMWPRLVPGKTYQIEPAKKLVTGDVIVFHHPHNNRRYLTKQICSINGETITVSGTVSWSSTWTIPIGLIIGKIIETSRQKRYAAR